MASPEPGASAFEVAGGTSRFGERTATSFMLMFDLEQAETDVRVSILGPRGWNSGATARRVFTKLEHGRSTSWINVYKDNEGEYMDVVAGDYVVQTSFGGETYRNTVTIDAGKTLELPAIGDVDVGLTTVDATWVGVKGAASYQVKVSGVSDADITDVAFHTREPVASFKDLALVSGETYRLRVTAMTADFSVGNQAKIPSGQFNTSYASATFTAP